MVGVVRTLVVGVVHTLVVVVVHTLVVVVLNKLVEGVVRTLVVVGRLVEVVVLNKLVEEVVHKIVEVVQNKLVEEVVHNIVEVVQNIAEVVQQQGLELGKVVVRGLGLKQITRSLHNRAISSENYPYRVAEQPLVELVVGEPAIVGTVVAWVHRMLPRIGPYPLVVLL